LRKRFESSGLSGFHSHEIVELLLTYAVPRRDVKEQAHALIDAFGSISATIDADGESVAAKAGLGPGTGRFFSLIREVVRMYIAKKFEPEPLDIEMCREKAAENWAKFWVLRLGGESVNYLEVAFLDGTYAVKLDAVERFTVDRAKSDPTVPREILSEVLRRKCSTIILCHNHPDGSQLPSEHDERFTGAVTIYMQTVGVRILDHIIIAGNCAFSTAEQREIVKNETLPGENL
jgi:DNA repair protein RadC